MFSSSFGVVTYVQTGQCQPLRSTAITQLLHYYGSGPPPYLVIGLFSLRIDAPCAFHLNIPDRASHVPCFSLSRVHATYTPDAIRTVNRFPPYCSRNDCEIPVLTSFKTNGAFSMIHLHSPPRNLPDTYLVPFP